MIKYKLTLELYNNDINDDDANYEYRIKIEDSLNCCRDDTDFISDCINDKFESMLAEAVEDLKGEW